ncbi:mechanosensitive ion channel [Synechococcus sp. ATX 2A4]|uniref:mechanosensitive ion channel family protein n=1 Tax=Synechococcus sp. ATX 2A4 TaxID=2823727 RepID=UPI0020CB8951|nr:mechanosensitive ion channel family protein [Synechococcus sp. ATX 2A4]MCP9884675.1 mechanosensitive ion channel [Synechococcus sp. ATX 2A4]
MHLLQVWLIALSTLALLLLVRNLCRVGRWPPFPLQLPVVATVVWAISHSLSPLVLPLGYRPWFALLDELALIYAAIRLCLWVGLELPAALKLWQRPPEILLQLLMLASGTVATVVVFKELARFDLLGLVTTSAVLTAMIGLAAQEPLKDLFAGLELQLDEHFRQGDFMWLEDGNAGVIVAINWRDTCLRDLTGTLLIIPNTKITSEVVRNLGAFGSMGNRFSIGLDYAFPTTQAKQLLLESVRQHPRVLAEPEPIVWVKEFADSTILHEIMVFQAPGGLADQLSLRSDLLEQIWYRLERAGQSIPYPVRELRRRAPQVKANQTGNSAGTERRLLLALNPLFKELEGAELDRLAGNTRCVRFAAGEMIVREGDRGGALYQVVKGSVDVLKRNAGAAPIHVASLQAGDLFGEMAMLADSTRSASVQATEECLLLEVNREHIAPLLQDNPELMERLAKLVSDRRAELEGMALANRLAQQNQLLRAMQQLFTTLSFSAERPEAGDGQGPAGRT